MSVTFATALAENPVFTYAIVCPSCEDAKSVPADNYEQALVLLVAHQDGVMVVSGCAQEPYYCDPSLEMTEPESAGAPQLNVTNINAVFLLEHLGFPAGDELVGSIDADDLLGRVLIAEALAPEDEGVESTQDGLMTYCGRQPGYLQDRLAELREVAEGARKLGRKVQWS